MITGYIYDIIIIFAFAIVIVAIGNKFRIPGIVGYILTGILIGPYGFGLISDAEIVDVLAEIGIIFLLFTIGMQFSFRKLLEMKKIVLIGGTIQVVFTILATMGITMLFGIPFSQAVFLGFLVCHSSTAITLKIYQDRAEIDSPHSRVTLGVSIYQDIITIPMLVALPILAGQTEDVTGALLSTGVTLALLFACIFAISAFVIPKFMNRITGTRSPEIFLLSIILICFVITYITSNIGLSVALGAFLAGLTLAESEYFHQAFASIAPFRDIFTSFFFISIGMLLNVWFLTQNPVLLICLVIGVLVLKAVIATGTTLAIGQSLRTSILAGLALCNIGEFAFILSTPGKEYGLFTESTEQIFLAVTVLTMSLTPLAISAGPRVADYFCRNRFAQRFSRGLCESAPPGTGTPLSDHVIIIGYGLNGRNLAKAANVGGIPYRIIDMNPDTVTRERANGEPISFGDATNPEILTHAGVESARILVVIINDPLSTRAITSLARSMNPRLHIIVRTRYVTEVAMLMDLGATEVIPEEFETSIEIFTRVLRKYLVSGDTIRTFIRDIRAGTYQRFRERPVSSASLSDLTMNIPDVEISTLTLHPESAILHQTLTKLNIRREYSVSVLAIRRGEEVLANPSGDTMLEAGDDVIVLGKPEDIMRLARQFCPDKGRKRETGNVR